MIFTLFGSAWLVYVAIVLWKLKTDDAIWNAYYERTYKSWFWQKIFGEDRAPEAMRTYGIGLGVVLWLVVLIALVVSNLRE